IEADGDADAVIFQIGKTASASATHLIKSSIQYAVGNRLIILFSVAQVNGPVKPFDVDAVFFREDFTGDVHGDSAKDINAISDSKSVIVTQPDLNLRTKEIKVCNPERSEEHTS